LTSSPRINPGDSCFNQVCLLSQDLLLVHKRFTSQRAPPRRFATVIHLMLDWLGFRLSDKSIVPRLIFPCLKAGVLRRFFDNE
jgi:hypothetical protein